MSKKDVLRLPAEQLYKHELDALKKEDKKEDKPAGWQLSPKAVLKYIIGGTAEGVEITPKYIGHDRLVEIAIATLLTDRSLLLIGEPGTAKSWLSENLTAAICGDSNKVIQGTAGTSEEQVKYAWNYAMLLANGPTEQALIKSPVYRAMETGSVARFEEISRCASEVQDALISIMSEKNIAIPELGSEVNAQRGFSIIATANTRDKGVNDMSSALKRRFNIIVLPSPADLETEVAIVQKRVKEIAANYQLKATLPNQEEVEKIVTIFRELRQGATLDNKQKLKAPSGVISTAEAISLLTNSMALAGSFGSGQIAEADLAAGLQGAIVKDEDKDKIVWTEYLENVMKKRGSQWRDLYNNCHEINK
ncbi:ATP-binding protein [Myroides pelagicus]|uniref:AAA domain-containing protein n=1 Tax=Myroides pelagicus TaxID=270914 RepID=A0A7K1GPU5_9FLAO|nr:AAA family ATPase [Myroides pelagicus]MEC4114215.1 AAA family ATPase [Myroides pelagicus]MTH30871.1 AAA domain-containing protein [Myroides pelagicus]